MKTNCSQFYFRSGSKIVAQSGAKGNAIWSMQPATSARPPASGPSSTASCSPSTTPSTQATPPTTTGSPQKFLRLPPSLKASAPGASTPLWRPRRWPTTTTAASTWTAWPRRSPRPRRPSPPRCLRTGCPLTATGTRRPARLCTPLPWPKTVTAAWAGSAATVLWGWSIRPREKIGTLRTDTFKEKRKQHHRFRFFVETIIRESYIICNSDY